MSLSLSLCVFWWLQKARPWLFFYGTVSLLLFAGQCPAEEPLCPCPPAPLVLWIFMRRNASFGGSLTGRIRQEMLVHLPCVGAYLGLSWGTNSKASLRSSRSEGTGSHLSTLWITDNKRGANTEDGLQTQKAVHWKIPEIKKRSKYSVCEVSGFYSNTSCSIRGLRFGCFKSSVLSNGC